MTAEITSLSESLQANPRSYSELTESERDTLATVLNPKGPWSDEQYELVRQWFLVATPALIGTWNDALPRSIRVGGSVTKDGRTVLSADLLSDCGQGQTYEAIGDGLRACKMVKLSETDFPTQEGD